MLHAVGITREAAGCFRAQPRVLPPASETTAYKSPHAQPQQPILHSTRANPFPKVTGLICRLPLPAFIISNRGCSPWGPDAVMGTLRRRILSRTVFQGPPVANWTPDNTRRSAKTHLFLPTSGFHSVCLDLSNRKEISAQCDYRQRHRHSVRHRIYFRVQEYQPASLSPVSRNYQTA